MGSAALAILIDLTCCAILLLIGYVAASTLDPSCAMGGVLGAYVALLSTEGAGVARARAALASATERDSVSWPGSGPTGR